MNCNINRVASCGRFIRLVSAWGRSSWSFQFAAALALLAACTGVSAGEATALFGVRVVDDQTGRGVPLVALTTTHHVTYYTDSQGWAAIDAPELMGQHVFFHVRSHGYEFRKDAFGYSGVRLRVVPGTEATVKIKRINIAERLYRVTGAGVYSDSLRLGKQVPLKQPLLNAQVTGSDSVVNAVFRGKLYWFWGDTNRFAYPLGNFNVPGAVSDLPASGGLPPGIGVNLRYFVNENSGFAKETARMPGKGPTWINGLTALADAQGDEHLFTGFVKVAKPMKIYARGIAEFDTEREQFVKSVDVPVDAPLFPHGHPFVAGAGDRRYIYFASPYALSRVKSAVDAFLDISQYEAYTYFHAGDHTGEHGVDRSPDGTLRLGWKKDSLPPSRKQESQLVAKGELNPDERMFVATDVETGKAILLHSGSMAWNDYRKKWIMIALTSFNTSMLGEIWYGESDRIEGPWRNFRRIVTHDRYSFYNPKHHSMLNEDGGRIIYFEGTYTQTFSGNPVATPRYNYNQIMYRLDLADARLHAAPSR